MALFRDLSVGSASTKLLRLQRALQRAGLSTSMEKFADFQSYKYDAKCYSYLGMARTP